MLTQRFVKKQVFMMLAGLLAVSLSATAQDSRLTFGVKGGLNISNFYQTEVGDEKSKVGFHVGAFVRTPIVEDLLSIQPEVLYTLAGSQTEYSYNLLITKVSGKNRFNLGYLQIPLLVRADFGGFNVHAGPYGSFLLHTDFKNLPDQGSSTTTTVDKDKLNGFDYGLVGGVGFTKEHFSVGLRYNYGLQEVGKDNGIDLSFSGVTSYALQGSKNSVLQLYAAYEF